MPSIDCRDENDEGRHDVEDLLGIDNDGSFLFPLAGKKNEVVPQYEFHSPSPPGKEFPSAYEDEISTVFDAYSSMNDVVLSRNNRADLKFV